ncbi:uncharacterized protein TNIN_106261 [Trichonephila inaurata madagascariensis]|uniref:Uncharacterized protein n=1 Tax=Trichonephila inaurata madagascariensis TaxID=2747483 RepID=A0A8X6X3W6_9ARAC|nr:uncharacterized protein TNIN_106261 [Trichonephila inaurata madagascariensis]
MLFDHLDMTECWLMINNVMVPTVSYMMDFEKNDYNRLYTALLESGLNTITSETGCMVNYSDFEDGSVISLPQRCVKRASDYLQLNVIIPLHFVYLGSKDTGDMKILYGGRDGGVRICGLSKMCQKLLIALEEETNEYNTFPEIHTRILKYLIQMCHILRDEKNFECKKTGCDILCELTDRLT